MATDVSRRPTIAGIGQLVQRVDDPAEAVSPIEMMENAIRKAAEDAGAPKLVEHLDAIYVPRGTWQYGNPGKLLGERLGSPNATSITGAVSGHIVQILLNMACREIAAGKADVIAIVGGESENSRRKIAGAGKDLHWEESPEGEPDLRFGDEYSPPPGAELRAGTLKPSVTFSLADTSMRRARGETPDAHRKRISEVAARLSAVAAKNPYAWTQQALTAEEIREPTPDNRMVTYPYTKRMTSNISVDQSAAVIVCSGELAARLGIADDRHVHVRAATEMSHANWLSHRQELHRHPGLEIAGQRVLEIAGVDGKALSHIDLYSCFPFAVQAGAAALGLDEQRELSVTGGLLYSGGPLGNYVLQAQAAMVGRLRGEPGSVGLVGSVGGSFAKFAFSVMSTDPGDQAGPIVEDVSAEFAAMPERDVIDEYDVEATIESTAVDVLRGGEATTIAAGLDDAGHRVWGRSEDPELSKAILGGEDVCGKRARFAKDAFELV